MDSIEREILICAAEVGPNPVQQQKLRHAMLHLADPDRLITTAVKEGLAGLLYKGLKNAAALQSLEARHKERLESLYYGTVRFNLKLIHDLKRVLEVLNEKKLPVVLLQGIALLAQIYEDIGLRPLTDIDLWVLPKDYHGLIAVLSSLGYQRDALYPNTLRKGSTVIDINTHVLGADRIRTRALLLAIDQEHIYRDAVAITFEGYEALCLNKYDQVLLLGVHALKHSISRLIWLADIRCLIAALKRPDWKLLMNRAKEIGQEKTFGYVLFLLAQIFDHYLPIEFRQLPGTEGIAFFEKKVLGRRIAGDCLPLWAPFLLLSSGRPLVKRIFFLTENLFPRPEILRQVFPGSADSGVWQLYLKRVLQLAGMIKVS
jgi:hypothetical protein